MGARRTTPDTSHVIARSQPTKADSETQPRLSSIVGEALRRAHGSQKAAAIVIATDPGNLSRDLRAGRLSLLALERFGDDVLREVGALLVEEYGAVDPRERARRLLPQLVDELLRLVE